jgi:hypothetical protein
MNQSSLLKYFSVIDERLRKISHAGFWRYIQTLSYVYEATGRLLSDNYRGKWLDFGEI